MSLVYYVILYDIVSYDVISYHITAALFAPCLVLFALLLVACAVFVFVCVFGRVLLYVVYLMVFRHTCHILPPFEIDLGLCLVVFADSGGKHLFHRIG